MTGVFRYPVGLDPLDFDRVAPLVCEMNAEADVAGLVRTLRDVVPAEEFVTGLAMPDCRAAMRDLGVLMGSIKRHGVEPAEAVPELRGVLTLLGTRTCMVPRDTIFHYVGWNPAGRERTYTGEPMERILMSSVRVTLPRLDAAIAQCVRINQLEPHQLEFTVAVNELVALLRSLEDAIDIVHDGVIPEFFARTLRPFFESITLDGVEYLGPAAAHVPLYLLDLALWASDRGGKEYERLWSESAQYGLVHWRALCRRWADAPSVASRVATALASTKRYPDVLYVRAGAAAVCRALRALVVFRGKHLATARQAYAESIRLYQLGSGGGSVHLLDEITRLTRTNANSLAVPRNRGREVG